LYEKALKYFNQAAQLSEKAGKLYADPINNIGNLYYKQGNYTHKLLIITKKQFN
jgi:tetratricopeptide (TPR) repeat protein